MLALLSARARSVFGAPRSTAVARPAGLARPLIPAALHAAVPLAVAGVWAVIISHVRVDDMTDLGLVSVLPLGVILLLFLLTGSFCLALSRRPLNGIVPLLHVVVLIVMLYGITTFIESEPRVGIEWHTVGIIDFILGHGDVKPVIDAFFNWPGFFALGALISRAAGFHSALAFAAWGPLFFNLVFLAPLVMIFRWASDDPRVTWLGLWVFYSTNWVAQDLISPQAAAYTLWLTILAALLTWFTPRPAVLAGRPSVRRLRRLFDLRRLIRLLKRDPHAADTPGLAGQRAGLLLLIVAMYGATVAGHQLTPVPAILTVIGLVLFARLETRSLPVIMLVLLAAWISFMTTAYLAGNLSLLTGSLGSISQNLTQSTGARVVGSHQHELIVNIRFAATAAIWLLAAAGFGRRLWSGYVDLAMVVIAGAPFLLPLLQPYGGEILLRVFLFALPATSFAIAGLAFPSILAGRSWLTLIGVAVVSCALLVMFQYTRYGNERLDNFTTGDLSTVQAFYRIAPVGSTVYAGTDNIPWRYERYAGYDYGFVSSLPNWSALHPDPAKLAAQLEATLRSAGGGYVIVTRSTEVEAELLEGKPYLLQRLVAVLRASGQFRELYSSPDGEIFYLPRVKTASQTPLRRSSLARKRSAPIASVHDRSARAGRHARGRLGKPAVRAKAVAAPAVVHPNLSQTAPSSTGASSPRTGGTSPPAGASPAPSVSSPPANSPQRPSIGGGSGTRNGRGTGVVSGGG